VVGVMRAIRAALTIAIVGALVPAASGAAATIPADSTVVLTGSSDLLSTLATPVSDSDAEGHVVSSNGQRIAFTSDSDGLRAGHDARVRIVHGHVLPPGRLFRAGLSTAGVPASRNCGSPSLSAGGTRVAFECNGPLDAADTNNVTDVYVRDLSTNQTFLVS